jgi:hypothetical protein
METKASARTANHPTAEPAPRGRSRRFPARLKGEQQTKTLRDPSRCSPAPACPAAIPRGLRASSIALVWYRAKGLPCKVRGSGYFRWGQ